MRLLLAAAVTAGLLCAATAALDCTGDSASARRGARWVGSERSLALDTPRKLVALHFRSTSLKGWRASGAKLVAHFDRGQCAEPKHLLVAYVVKYDEKARTLAGLPAPAAFTHAPCSDVGAGWWQIDLPASIAQGLVDSPDGAILLASPAHRSGPVLHSRETLAFAPRLLVEGVAP